MTGHENNLSHLRIGLDIGGTNIEALAVDPSFNVVGKFSRATHADTPEHLVASAVDAIQQVLAEAQVTPRHLNSIGIGVPGLVETETGIVRLAANLNLTAYPLGAVITQTFGVPTFLENDVRLAAIGVYRWLQEREITANMAYLSIGTGVSAGVVLNGRLHRGSHGMAGEIGHITVEPNGALCNCGARGCLETIIAGPAIVKQARGQVSFAVADHEVHAGHVYQAARQGNPAAQKIIKRVGDYMARAVQYLIMTYDVDKVIVGGGVTAAGDAFLTPLFTGLAKLRQQSDLFDTMLSENKLCLLPQDYNAGTWGAVYLPDELHQH